LDAWYANRDAALDVAEAWTEHYPSWNVGLVCSDLIWFSGRSYREVSDKPLTRREAAFAGTESDWRARGLRPARPFRARGIGICSGPVALDRGVALDARR
jgi:hypothetical protein